MGRKIIGVTVGTSLSPEKVKEKAQLATQEYVDDKVAEAQLSGGEVDLNGYVQESELPEVINDALAQAKASGEFDGVDGEDGTSATHEWNGTILTITSASGSTSADLKGEPGKDGKDGYTPVKGVDYDDGKNGSDGKDGSDGVTPEFSIGTVETLDASSDATVTIGGTAENPILNFGIPKGADGGGGGFTMELLWQNKSPGSGFEAQTIAVDVSQYDMVAVECYYGTDSTKQTSTITFTPLYSRFSLLNAYGGDFRSRLGEVKQNGVQFYPGYASTTNSLSAACVPVKIYGVKGVF